MDLNLSNEEKAKRLESLAEVCVGADAALLCESAAMWRERDGVRWDIAHQCRYKRFDLCIGEGMDHRWHWTAERGGQRDQVGAAESLEAAKQAAIAWVDAQEGKV